MNIGIIGNGYVGSATAWCLGTAHNIYVYDTDPVKSTHSLEDTVNECEAMFICVPTPSNDDGTINLSIIERAIKSITDIRKDKLLIIKSTGAPGTCKRLANQFGVHIASNPEFLTERRAKFDSINPAQLLIGTECSEDKEVMTRIYEQRFTGIKYTFTDTVTAELAKYMLNCFFSVKVSYVNLFKQICDKNGAHWEQLLEAFVGDSRVTDSHIQVPGPDGKLGFGGHCFPKDINALMAEAENLDVDIQILSAVWEYNKQIRWNGETFDINDS